MCKKRKKERKKDRKIFREALDKKVGEKCLLVA